MGIELIAEAGVQRQHRNSLRRLLDTTSGPVRVSSAYVTDDDLLLSVKTETSSF